MNTAIIVAAGEGKRFGGETPKQFLEIAGKPLVIHTLRPFEDSPEIQNVILALPGAEIARFRDEVEKYRLKKLSAIVAGGATRALSVLEALNVVDTGTAGIIAVHDGARPLVSAKEISRTVKKASETGAACLVAAVTDTIKEVSGDKIIRTVDREGLRRALTPQCFRYEILRRAFAENDLDAPAATDESYLVEKLGVEVSLVEGSPRNIKITHPEDFALAERLLSQ